MFESPPKAEHFYDIIGDVHGYANELIHLLQLMGYSNETGTWSHSFRKAIFVGDFINRGPESRKVISIIRGMVDNGVAHAILGNHEMNAIMYFTHRNDDTPIRIPNASAQKLLQSFALEYHEDEDALIRDVKWMRTLPLFLELDNFRVVHAYWSNANIKVLRELNNQRKWKKSFLREVVKKSSPYYKAFNETLKGIEFCLPNDLVIKDTNNMRRNSFRIKWWIRPEGQTFKSLCYESKFKLPDYTIPSQLIKPMEIYSPHAPIIFIGHYCMGNGPFIPAPNICCVDACVANGGRLAAYRWNGEEALNEAKFVFTKRHTEKPEGSEQ